MMMGHVIVGRSLCHQASHPKKRLNAHHQGQAKTRGERRSEEKGPFMDGN